MRKIVYYIYEVPILSQFKEKHGINYMLNNGWEVHLIDLSPIINPIHYKNITSALISAKERELFFRKKDYLSYIHKSSDGSFFLFRNDFRLESYFYHRAVRKTQAYGYIGRTNTNVENGISFSKKISKLFDGFNFHHAFASIFIRLPRTIFPIQPARFIALGGTEHSKLYSHLAYKGKNTIVKYIHSNDYEEFLAKKNEERIVVGPYFVFLDQYVPYHPDSLAAGYVFDAEEYFDSMTRLFRLLECKFNIKAVIAAHPKANYGKGGYFSEFEIIRFKTCELVKDAEFVLTHYSTSIAYAVLFNKPVLLVTTKDIKKILEYSTRIQETAQILGCVIWDASNISSDEVNSVEICVNTTKYMDFICRFIKANYGKIECDTRLLFEQIEELMLTTMTIHNENLKI